MNKLDLAELPSTATNAYNLKCSQLLSMKVQVSRLCCKMQPFAQFYMGESQLLTRLVPLNTIPTAITVTTIQKILISQRKHPSLGAGSANISASFQWAHLSALLNQDLTAQNIWLGLLVLES